MIKIYIFLIFTLSLVSQIKSKLQKESLKKEKIDIKIISLELPQESCIPSLSTFLFNINVEFSKSPEIIKMLSIDLSSNIKSLCYPFEKTNVTNSFFQCKINTVNNPIKYEIIYLPLNAPISDDYNFLNWKETIGKTPEVSNRIINKEIYCIPKEINSFKLKEIIKEDCQEGKNRIALNGQWLYENKFIPKNFEFQFDKIKGKCEGMSFIWIKCLLEGEGDLSFSNDYYFEYGINPYMIQKNKKIIHINNCNDENYISFIFYPKIFIFLILLLI